MQRNDFSTISVAEALAELRTSDAGITDAEAAARLKIHGANELPEAKKRSVLMIFLKQFRSVLVAVLIVAAALSWITGHRTDAYVILIVVFIDALIGFIQEWKAEQAVSALHKMLVPHAKVIRQNHKQIVKAADLVPGDIIILEEGDYVPADARLTDVKHLRTIEAALTGESLPINKTSDAQAAAISIGDRKNMVWRSTFVSGGYGKAVITATGSGTAIGKIAKSLSDIKVSPSHFQKKIDRLGTQMGIASVIAAIVLFGVGYLTLDMDINELFLLSVAAMVSIIPEGLPSIIAIVLAIGSRRMTKRNAIVREFTATETLGAVTTIITDKTGTLTENALTVKKIFLPDQPEVMVTGEGWAPIGSFLQGQIVLESQTNSPLKKLLAISALCNNSSVRRKPDNNMYELIGDPTEGALLVLAKRVASTRLHSR